MTFLGYKPLPFPREIPGFHLEPIHLCGSQGRSQSLGFGNSSQLPKNPLGGSFSHPLISLLLLFWLLFLHFALPKSQPLIPLVCHLSLSGDSCWDFFLPAAREDGAVPPPRPESLCKCPWQELRAPGSGSLPGIGDFNRHQNRKTFPVTQSRP